MTEEEIKVLKGLDWLAKNSVYGVTGILKKENNIDPEFERKWEQFETNHNEFDKRFHAQKAEIEAERRRIEERTRQFREKYNDKFNFKGGYDDGNIKLVDEIIENTDGSYDIKSSLI